MRKAMMLGLALVGMVALPNAAVAENCAGSRWGEITPKGCAAACQREYSAILWSIPSGSSWEICCRETPSSALGKPHHCVNRVTNIWGVWFKEDNTCPGACPEPSCPKGQKYCRIQGKCIPDRQQCK